ncbi:MAG: SDR family oxidoreductase [Actinomycetota bacterium]|nr:SDR family oxidoreductase [Actinomycetota bacterium]
MSDRVAIVTGAARGIGLAIATRLSSDGFSVVVADTDTAVAEQPALALPSAISCHVDVSQPASVRDMVDSTLSHFGRVDVLVNNAGITGPSAPLSSYPDEEWRRVQSVDLDGVFYCCKAVLPQMQKQGKGRIINMASVAGKEGNPNMCAYSAAKAGVIGLTKSLGKELATTGILVNCVTPAVIETELLRELSPEAVRYMLERVPMGRAGRLEEVAALVAWLASDECSFSTGAVFDLSGGRATY